MRKLLALVALLCLFAGGAAAAGGRPRSALRICSTVTQTVTSTVTQTVTTVSTVVSTVTQTVTSTVTQTVTDPGTTTAPPTTTMPPPPPPPPPPANWAGTFDCYGSGPNCAGLTPATCTTTVAATSLQAALNSTSGGSVLCVTTGSTGNIALTSKAYSSDVIVQPAAGATVTVGAVTLNAVAHLHFTGVGDTTGSASTMSIAGSNIDLSSSASASLTFDHITYTGPVSLELRGSNISTLFDHDRFDNLGSGLNEARFAVRNVSGSAADGITVSNSHFGGTGFGGGSQTACSDGVEVEGATGTTIGPGNEFTGIDQSYAGANCSSPSVPHVDPVSGFSDGGTTVVGNYFHDNGSGSGGILSDVSPSLTVKNNVFASTGYPHSILVKGARNNTYTHNVLAGDIDWQLSNAGQSGSGNLVRNDVGGAINLDGSSTTYIADHNLGSGRGQDIPGTPTYVSSPASGYYHYELASSSAGYHAGSDGNSVGICSSCG